MSEQRNNEIQLQGVGWVPAVPARELVVGNVMMWNSGGTSVVVSIEEASAKFLTIVERYKDARGGEKDYPRRVKKDRLIGLSVLKEHRVANPQLAKIATRGAAA